MSVGVGIWWPAAHPARLLSMARLHARERPQDADLDDAALVSRAARGDREAFDALHRSHVAQVWSRLTRLLGPDPEREDLTQQIFLDVFRGLGAFRGEATFRTYLNQVVVHVACDHLGRRRRRPQPASAEAIEMLSAPDASPETRAEQRQRLVLTWMLLDRIKAKKRVAFILRAVEGLSLDEVSQLVNASVATVAKRVMHAENELRRMLARRRRRGEDTP